MVKYLWLGLITLAIALFVALKQVEYVQGKLDTATANIKNYDVLLAASKSKSSALQLTVDQLSYFKDSVLQKLDATRKELKVKDKSLKALQQVKSSFSKSDTIILNDTIFRDRLLALDTLMGDGWYTLRLGLHYPSVVIVEPEFKSEKHIVVSSKKETVNPPKKFFLLRWFQKRHNVLTVDVVEKNPYVDGESSRYVEIIK